MDCVEIMHSKSKPKMEKNLKKNLIKIYNRIIKMIRKKLAIGEGVSRVGIKTHQNLNK